MHSIYVCINNMHSIQQLLYFSRKLAKHHRPSMISAHTSYDPKASTRITQLLRDMIAAVEANDLNPVLDKTFNLENLADAFRLQESQQHFGKIGVEIK